MDSKRNVSLSLEQRILELEKELSELRKNGRKERECALVLVSQITEIFWGYDNEFNAKLKNTLDSIDTDRPLYDQLDGVLSLQKSLHEQAMVINTFNTKISEYLQNIPESIKSSNVLPQSFKEKAEQINSEKEGQKNKITVRVLLTFDSALKSLEHYKNVLSKDATMAIPPQHKTGLQSVITGIELPSELNNELQRYIAILQDKNNIITYSDVLELFRHIMSIVIKGFNSERDYAVTFFSNLNEHINTIQDQLSSSLESNRSVQLAARENNTQFSTELSEISDYIATKYTHEVTKILHDKLDNLSKLIKTRDSFLDLHDKLIEDLGCIENKITSIKKQASEFQSDIKNTSNKSKVDVLTGLNNRFSFDQRYEHDLLKIGNPEYPELGVILADIDGFQIINQKYGDYVGDKILKVLGLTLRHTVRETDFVSRLGSDFFAIIIYTSDPENIKILASKLIAAVKAIPFHYKNEKVPVTISIVTKMVTEKVSPGKLLNEMSAILEQKKKEFKAVVNADENSDVMRSQLIVI